MIYDFDLIVNCVRLINDQRRLIVRYLRVATQLLVLAPGALGTSLVDNTNKFIHLERQNKQAVWPPNSADTVCPRPPLTLTFARLTLKLVCESNQLLKEVTSATSLSIFQRRLKTFLFRKSFPDIIAN